MDTTLEAVCLSLDELASTVLLATSDDRTLKEWHGWHHPSLTRKDLAAIASNLATTVRAAGPEDISNKEHQALLADFPRRLKLLYPDTVPQMFNGNGHQAVPAYIGTVEGLRLLLEPIIGWVPNPENRLMPAPLARRLRSYQATLDGLAPDADKLRAQILQIQEATEAAEMLPTDLQALAEAKLKVDKFASDAGELYGKLDQRGKDIAELLTTIKGQEQEAAKLVEQCGQAYRVTTTKGLAAAFDNRATRISVSMWVWVAGLLFSLLAATYLGAERMKLLSNALAGADPQWGVIWMQAVLSLLSVGAPLWFAWVATKQVAQRFRLAEDYGFKASVAKAYEGYRREAARIDPEFEARLFSSALTRLEEAPLRLVDSGVHGSPWHELVDSQAFKNALETIPELKTKFYEVAGKGMDAFRATVAPRKPDTPDA